MPPVQVMVLVLARAGRYPESFWTTMPEADGEKQQTAWSTAGSAAAAFLGLVSHNW